MNKAELNKYKKLLIQQKIKLFNELKTLQKDNLKTPQRDAVGDLSGYVYHIADVATDNFNRELSLDLATVEQRALYEIEEALKRIEDKNFGNCLDCGQPIAKRRLAAVPQTDLCIKCQTKKEAKKK